MNPVRQFLLPVASMFQIAGSALPQIFSWGVNIGERSRALDTAIVPAGWAFSIWGLIFLWSGIFAFYAAFQREAEATLLNRVSWPAIIAFAMNGLWGIYTAVFGLNIGSEIIIVIGLGAAVIAALIAGRVSPKSTPHQFLVAAPLGLLAGWLTAASFIGASSILLGLGIEMTDTVLLIILTGATIFAASILLLKPSITYLAAVLWALAAVISKNLSNGNETILYAASFAAIALAVLAFWKRFSEN